MIRYLLTSLLVAGLMTMNSVETSAAKFNKKVDIGDKAGDWKDLSGTDGKKHSLSDYEKADVLVIAFTIVYFGQVPAWTNIAGIAMVFAGVTRYLRDTPLLSGHGLCRARRLSAGVHRRRRDAGHGAA